MELLIESIFFEDYNCERNIKEKQFYGNLLFDVLQNREYKNIRIFKKNITCIICLYPVNYTPSNFKSLEKLNNIPEIINDDKDQLIYKKEEICKFFSIEKEHDDFCKIS